MRYVLGLGSNKGNREGFLQRGREFLAALGTVTEQSSVYRTAPLGMGPGAGEFLNQVVVLESESPPGALLRKIKEFEKGCGRDLENSHMKPREIDIDILFAGSEIVHTPDLTIPHPEIENRSFVLLPLREILPRLVHPVSGKRVEEMLAELTPDDPVIQERSEKR